MEFKLLNLDSSRFGNAVKRWMTLGKASVLITVILPISVNFWNWSNFQKVTHNSMQDSCSTPISTNLVGVHPRNIHTKFLENLREVEKVTTTTTTDTG